MFMKMLQFYLRQAYARNPCNVVPYSAGKNHSSAVILGTCHQQQFLMQPPATFVTNKKFLLKNFSQFDANFLSILFKFNANFRWMCESVLHNCISSPVFIEIRERLGHTDSRNSPISHGRPVSTFRLSKLMQFKIYLFKFTFL